MYTSLLDEKAKEVAYSTEEGVWVAVINWDDIHEVAQVDQLLPVAAD